MKATIRQRLTDAELRRRLAANRDARAAATAQAPLPSTAAGRSHTAIERALHDYRDACSRIQTRQLTVDYQCHRRAGAVNLAAIAAAELHRRGEELRP